MVSALHLVMKKLKSYCMKTNSTHQEILVMTNTTFSERQWCEKDNSANSQAFTNEEKLEEACWNGLLPELLPEIIGTSSGGRLYLWQIRHCRSFLEIDLCEYPLLIENYFSIDPYLFLSAACPN